MEKQNIPALAEDGPRKESNNRRRGRMRRSGKSQNNLEATQLTAILSTRATVKVGTWNMMSMYAAGKLGQVINEMRNNGLTIHPGNQ